jgi:hypothetical protein
MNARIATTLPAFGQQIEGGRLHGIFMLGTELWGEVSAPKAEGELTGHVWHPKYEDIPGAASDFDGLANTIAMTEAGSPLAQAARALRIDGHDDWYVPARGGQLMQWANLKPLLTGDDAFEAAEYWSSTQYSRYGAYYQGFGYGGTDFDVKSWEGGRARAVRRFRIE